MNCDSNERYILLDQTGELSARRKRLVSRHLASCPNCKDYALQLDRLREAARTLGETPDRRPGDGTAPPVGGGKRSDAGAGLCSGPRGWPRRRRC